MSKQNKIPNKHEQGNSSLGVVGNSNIVKEIRVNEILGHMMDSDMELYEKILDTDGFAYYFNELVKLAQK